MRVGIVGLDPHRFAQRGDAPGVVARLDEHETEVVVGVGEIGLEVDRLTELGGHRAAVGARAAEQAAEDVMGIGSVRARDERLSEGGDGPLPVRRRQPGAGEVQPSVELSHRLFQIGREEIRDPEVHVDGGGGWEEGDRALQALPGSGEVPRLAQRGSEKRVAAAGGGVELDALSQLGQGPIAGAAVPERHPEVEVRFRGLRP